MATIELRPQFIERVALAAADAAGGVLAWQNQHGGTVLVHRVIFNVTTKATAACTLDVGVTATSAATSSDTLMDGVDVGTAVGVFDNVENQGTNGVSAALVAAGKWITASKASGAAAGLAGYAYIFFTPTD